MGFTFDMVTGDFFEDNTASSRDEILIEDTYNNRYEYSYYGNLSHVVPNSDKLVDASMVIPDSLIVEDIDAFLEEVDTF